MLRNTFLFTYLFIFNVNFVSRNSPWIFKLSFFIFHVLISFFFLQLFSLTFFVDMLLPFYLSSFSLLLFFHFKRRTTGNCAAIECQQRCHMGQVQHFETKWRISSSLPSPLSWWMDIKMGGKPSLISVPNSSMCFTRKLGFIFLSWGGVINFT